MGHGRCSHASRSLQVVLIPQSNESDVSCTTSCLRLSKFEHFFCSELSCLPATLSFTLSSFSVRMCWLRGIIGANLDCSSFLSMPYSGYTRKCWRQYYDPGLDVSEHSMYVNISSEYVLNASFQPNAVHSFRCGTLVLFRNCNSFCLTSPHKVGRMMMNIRGLIMDDPEHTTHLQTLQFATRTNAGSEIEEGTGGEA